MERLRKYMIVLLLALLFPIGQAQSDNINFQLLFTCKEKAILVRCDKLGNIYTSNGTIIYKYNTKGELLCSFSHLTNGKISSIDPYNPMKILVFSRDFLHITFLDTYLSPLNTISGLLSDYNLYQPTLVCASHDNGFWVYDEVVEQLFRFDFQGKKSNESLAFSQIATEKIMPNQIQETESGYIIVNDINYGLLVFDQFGTYIKTIPIPQIRHFDTFGNLIVYTSGNKLIALDISNLHQQSVDLLQNDVQNFAIQDNIIVCLNNDGNVSVYKWKPL